MRILNTVEQMYSTLYFGHILFEKRPRGDRVPTLKVLRKKLRNYEKMICYQNIEKTYT